MAKDAFRKAYPKLLRDPYDFSAPKDALDQEEKLRVVKNCECSEPSTGFIDPIPDSLDPPQEGETPVCSVSRYAFCGTTGGDSLSELPVVYIAKHLGIANPDVIFIPGIAPDGGGACYFLDDPEVNCDAATDGISLDTGQYVVVSHCNEPPCSGIQNTCEYLRLNICDNLPQADDPLFSPKTIVVHASFWGGVSFPRTVRWRNVCYRTPSNPCIPEPDPNDVQPPFADLEKEDNCDVEECLCCDNAADALQELVDMLKERLLFANSGSLPDEAGHNFSDADYILNATHPDVANGNTVNTLCHDRSETWRLYFVEIDFWLHASSYGYNNADFWMDIDAYPGGSLEGAGHVANAAAFDQFVAADYETQIQATTSHDWFRFAFGSNPDPFGHIIEYFTMGGEGGFGNINLLRFGDSNPHVVVDNPDDHRFCNLVNSTISRMKIATQKLEAIIRDSLPSTTQPRDGRDSDASEDPSCETAKGKALNSWNANSWYSDNPSVSSIGLIERVSTLSLGPDNYRNSCSSRRGKIQLAATSFAGKPIFLFVTLTARTEEPAASSHTCTAAPVPCADNKMHQLLGEGTTESDGSFATEFIANEIPTFTLPCPGVVGNLDYGGWAIAGAYFVIHGHFTT